MKTITLAAVLVTLGGCAQYRAWVDRYPSPRPDVTLHCTTMELASGRIVSLRCRQH